jgi:hypothetical protein
MNLCGLLVGCLFVGLSTSIPTLVASAGPALQRRQPVPRPFPRPGDSVETPALRPVDPTPTPEAPAVAPNAGAKDVPTAAMLGLPIYPNAQFITSYDAGRGQRYYLFGTNSSFKEMVSYYSVVLDERGDLVFDAPATHMFEVGRFREKEMAFPPGVTVKDYTWSGSEGYLNPTGGEPARFRTIIQLVPAPSGQPRR